LSFTFWAFSAHPEEKMPKANRIKKKRNQFFIFISAPDNIILWKMNNNKEDHKKDACFVISAEDYAILYLTLSIKKIQ
jgi:hypothetical protein